jgi:hypothetical protein
LINWSWGRRTGCAREGGSGWLLSGKAKQQSVDPSHHKAKRTEWFEVEEEDRKPRPFFAVTLRLSRSQASSSRQGRMEGSLYEQDCHRRKERKEKKERK